MINQNETTSHSMSGITVQLIDNALTFGWVVKFHGAPVVSDQADTYAQAVENAAQAVAVLVGKLMRGESL